MANLLFLLNSAALPMWNEQQIYCLVKSKPDKHEVSRTVIYFSLWWVFSEAAE